MRLGTVSWHKNSIAMEDTMSDEKKRTRSKVAPLPGISEVEAYCVGTTPILFNRVQEETLLGLRDKTKKKSKAAPAPEDPREEAAPKLYTLNDDETPIIPTEMLFSCLADAGKHVRLDGKKQVSTAKSTVLPGLMSLHDPYIRILNPSNIEEMPRWEVDIRGGRNPNGGELVCIVRPRFDKWAFLCNLQVFTEEISVDTIRRLFDIAGARSGLGDFRPNRKGIYGQFRVERWSTS